MKTFSHIKIALLASSLLLSPAAWAEDAAPVAVLAEAQTAAELPWLYEGSDVPIDTSWTFGRLENGLRYAVKNNQVPAGQVSVRVRIDPTGRYQHSRAYLERLAADHDLDVLAFDRCEQRLEAGVFVPGWIVVLAAGRSAAGRRRRR